MDKFVIEGPNKLKGEVKVSGAKNSALPILIATLLTDKECVVKHVPCLRDIKTTIKLLEYLGKKVHFKNNTVTVRKNKPLKTKAPYNLVKQMRASFLVAGPLLTRFKHTQVPLPGGCAIGLRPIDIHLGGFAKMGAKSETKKGDIVIKAKKLHSAVIKLPYQSVGATENLILCAVMVSGKTIIKNFAKEPEITDLVNFLNSMGADIKINNTTITINGVKQLHGTQHAIIPDRIEAGTYLIASALTKGNVTVSNCNPSHLKSLITALRKAGTKITVNKNKISVAPSTIKSINVKTEPYPGFPTDLLSQWTVLMCRAKGQAKISESIFENRFMHIAELGRMDTLIAVDSHTALIDYTCQLLGANVMASDLRGGAALVLAGLIAKGTTTVDRIYHIDRGYEKMEEKLSNLGASIKRIK